MKKIILLFFVFFHLITGFGQATKNVSSRKISLQIEGDIIKLPYYRNIALRTGGSNIKRAVIIIHGTNRNANEYYKTAVDVVKRRKGDINSTIIIAPQFLTKEDIDSHKLGNNHIFWSKAGWKTGSIKSYTELDTLDYSSFSVIDEILQRLKTRYPNLQMIIITGHSAGGQFVQRYAACSPVFESIGIPIRCIVANPSSYLYLDNKRRVAGTLNEFRVPTEGCPDYNNYKYGLESLWTYPDNIGADRIRAQYRNREVIYLLGSEDNKIDKYLDVTCKAILQGNNRLERGQIYYNHLKAHYNTQCIESHTISIVKGVGHDNYKMFNSIEGIYHILKMNTYVGNL